MTALSFIFGDEGFENYKHVISPAIVDGTGAVTQVENAIYYGKFIQSGIDFVIIGFALFLVVSFINKARTKAEKLKADKEEEAVVVIVEDPNPTIEDLLTDIKVLLEKNRYYSKRCS